MVLLSFPLTSLGNNTILYPPFPDWLDAATNTNLLDTLLLNARNLKKES